MQFLLHLAVNLMTVMKNEAFQHSLADSIFCIIK